MGHSIVWLMMTETLVFGGNGFIRVVQDWTVTFGGLLYGVYTGQHELTSVCGCAACVQGLTNLHIGVWIESLKKTLIMSEQCSCKQGNGLIPLLFLGVWGLHIICSAFVWVLRGVLHPVVLTLIWVGNAWRKTAPDFKIPTDVLTPLPPPPSILLPPLQRTERSSSLHAVHGIVAAAWARTLGSGTFQWPEERQLWQAANVAVTCPDWWQTCKPLPAS